MEGRQGSPPRIAVIDGFRALAILGVVSLHLLILSGALAALQGSALGIAVWGLFGNIIDLFFIISGFVLFLPIVARGGVADVGRYALGRAARVFPAYWLTLGVVLVLIGISPTIFAPTLPGADSVVVHLLALQMPARMLDGGLSVGFGVDGPLWMISVIVGFYVVLPFVAKPYVRHPLVGLALAAAITVAWKEAAVHLVGVFEVLDQGSRPAWIVPLTVVDQLPGWAFSFGLGMTAAWAYLTVPRESSAAFLRRPLVVIAALLAYVICAYLYGVKADDLSGPIAGSAGRTHILLSLASSASRAALMAVIVFGPLWLKRPFANRFTPWLAELSYGLYLIHFVAAVYLAKYLGLPSNGTPGTVALWFAVVLPVSLAYAYLSLRFVERPVRRWVVTRERQAGTPRDQPDHSSMALRPP
jgi:peptidoglycan/LPS O-acetylase OafA/YrhL